jgi:hypothetical protein
MLLGLMLFRKITNAKGKVNGNVQNLQKEMFLRADSTPVSALVRQSFEDSQVFAATLTSAPRAKQAKRRNHWSTRGTRLICNCMKPAGQRFSAIRANHAWVLPVKC